MFDTLISTDSSVVHTNTALLNELIGFNRERGYEGIALMLTAVRDTQKLTSRHSYGPDVEDAEALIETYRAVNTIFAQAFDETIGDEAKGTVEGHLQDSISDLTYYLDDIRGL